MLLGCAPNIILVENLIYYIDLKEGGLSYAHKLQPQTLNFKAVFECLQHRDPQKNPIFEKLAKFYTKTMFLTSETGKI